MRRSRCTGSPEAFDFLNAHHLDYRGLIDKDLALKAHEGMYDNEQNKTNNKCEGCYYMGVWGCCRYCNTETKCINNSNYTKK